MQLDIPGEEAAALGFTDFDATDASWGLATIIGDVIKSDETSSAHA
jgi:hypothetical protein